MSYIINHNRGQCASEYSKLQNANIEKINNTKCIVLGYKNSGIS